MKNRVETVKNRVKNAREPARLLEKEDIKDRVKNLVLLLRFPSSTYLAETSVVEMQLRKSNGKKRRKDKWKWRGSGKFVNRN